ncbi:SufS family cysteine desulfurase [Pirellulaceae bacterium SH467]
MSYPVPPTLSPDSHASIESIESDEISARLLNQIFGTNRPSTDSIAAVAAHPLDVERAENRSAQETESLPEPVKQAIKRSDTKRFPHELTQQDIQHAVRSLQSESQAALLRKVKLSERGTTKDLSQTTSSVRALDVRSIRADFPALHQDINGHSLVWFDNGATTHKPLAVIEALSHFYACDYSNIHRAAHSLAARATDHYEASRETVKQFIGAESTKDIVFVRGTTEGINFIAQTCKSFLNEGDEILLTEMEHHANIVPWQLLADEMRLRIRVIPFNDQGDILIDEYRRLLTHRTKIVSVTHASNTLGTILPVAEMAAMAHRKGARFVVDGAQSIAHLPIDVQSLGCDFFVFSGHKVFAPTGIGVVYIHPDLQELLPPWQGGGNMIHRVSFDGTTFSDPPAKFEAGTPSIGDAIGLGAALRYLMQFDSTSLLQHEHSLLEHASQSLQSIPGVRTIGHSRNKVGLVSFVLDRYTTDQVGKELDRYGIAVRTGHHCAQPSLRHFGLESTVRPSFALYNTHEEIDRMIEVIHRLARKA